MFQKLDVRKQQAQEEYADVFQRVDAHDFESVRKLIAAENGVRAVDLVRAKLEHFSKNYQKHDFDEIGAASNILYRLDMFGDLSGDIIECFKQLHYKVNLDLMGYDIVQLTIKPKK